MTRRIDRRSFLALGAGALAWAACARDNGDPGADPVDPDEAVSLVVTAPQLVVGDTRMAFGLFQGGRVPISPASVEAHVLSPDGSSVPVQARRVPIAFGVGGDADPMDLANIYVFRHDFGQTGVWTVSATFEGGQGEGAFQVLEASAEPGPGDEAPASVSPTFDEPGGVDPVCTRNPPCSMHDMTIVQALDSGRPTVVNFGTPAFCTSRICGPVVDLVEEAKEEVGDEVNFVHVEVWRNNTDAVNNPPDGYVPAFAEWRFQTEPWTYFIGADGVVVERYLGPAGAEELIASARALLA